MNKLRPAKWKLSESRKIHNAIVNCICKTVGHFIALRVNPNLDLLRFISHLLFYYFLLLVIHYISPLASKILTSNSPSDRVWTVIISRNATGRSNFVNQSLHMSSPICSKSLGATALWISPKSRERRALYHVNQSRAVVSVLTCPLHGHQSDLEATVPANTSTSATSDSIAERRDARNEWLEID